MQADIVVNLLTGVEDQEGNRDYTLTAIAYVHGTLHASLGAYTTADLHKHLISRHVLFQQRET